MASLADQGGPNITFGVVPAPVTLARTRHVGEEAAPVTCRAGVPRWVPLVCRRHVDLLRVSSAMCPFCR